jgi:hypothetical protein
MKAITCATPSDPRNDDPGLGHLIAPLVVAILLILFYLLLSRHSESTDYAPHLGDTLIRHVASAQ